MENEDKVKNKPINGGRKIDKMNRFISQSQQAHGGMQHAFVKPDLYAVELAVQLLKAETRLQGESGKRKQAESQLHEPGERLDQLLQS